MDDAKPAFQTVITLSINTCGRVLNLVAVKIVLALTHQTF